MTAGLGRRLLPTTLRTDARQRGVMGRVLGISVTEVVLHRAQICALVGQVVAAGVAQNVRPDAPELRLLAGNADDIVDGLARHRLGRITVV